MVCNNFDIGEYDVYAIIEDSGKQYKVEQGDLLCVDQRSLADDQTELEFDKVIFYRDDETTVIGQPVVEGAKVKAKVNGIANGPKLYPLHFRRRKNSQSRIGHRQKYLEVQITEITRTA